MSGSAKRLTADAVELDSRWQMSAALVDESAKFDPAHLDWPPIWEFVFVSSAYRYTQSHSISAARNVSQQPTQTTIWNMRTQSNRADSVVNCDAIEDLSSEDMFFVRLNIIHQVQLSLDFMTPGSSGVGESKAFLIEPG